MKAARRPPPTIHSPEPPPTPENLQDMILQWLSLTPFLHVVYSLLPFLLCSCYVFDMFCYVLLCFWYLLLCFAIRVVCMCPGCTLCVRAVLSVYAFPRLCLCLCAYSVALLRGFYLVLSKNIAKHCKL